MRFISLLFLLSLMISSAANADLLDALKSVNQGLGALSGKSVNTGTSPSNHSDSSVIRAKLTDAQENQLSAELSKKVSNEQLRVMIKDAGSAIAKVLGMQACFYGNNTYAPYISDEIFLYGVQPTKYNFKHHDISQCVSIQRISNWQATARNAMAFKVVYVSEQSGESVSRSYEIQKDLDGTWLFNK